MMFSLFATGVTILAIILFLKYDRNMNDVIEDQAYALDHCAKTINKLQQEVNELKQGDKNE